MRSNRARPSEDCDLLDGNQQKGGREYTCLLRVCMAHSAVNELSNHDFGKNLYVANK